MVTESMTTGDGARHSTRGQRNGIGVDCLRYTCQGVLHSGGPGGGTCVLKIEDSPACLKGNFATWKLSLVPLFLADFHKLGGQANWFTPVHSLTHV